MKESTENTQCKYESLGILQIIFLVLKLTVICSASLSKQN